MTAATENKKAEKAFDASALAALVTDSSEEISREGGAGRPKQENPFMPHVVAARKDGKVKELPVPHQEAAEKVTSFLRRAASDNGHGLSTKIVRRGNKLVVLFQAKDKKSTNGKAECPVCHSQVTITGDSTLRVHGPQNDRCKGSGAKVG